MKCSPPRRSRRRRRWRGEGGTREGRPRDKTMQFLHTSPSNLAAIALSAPRRGRLPPSDASPAPRCPIRSCSTTSWRPWRRPAARAHAQPGAARDAQLAGAPAFRKDDAPTADQGGNAMTNVVNWILARASIDNSRKYSNRQSHQGSNVGILERWFLSNTK